MNDRVIRVGEVAELLGVGKSTVWLWDSEGKIPKSFKLTPATTVWRYSEIIDWLDAKQKESYANPDTPKQGDIPNARHKTEAKDNKETPYETKFDTNNTKLRHRVNKKSEA